MTTGFNFPEDDGNSLVDLAYSEVTHTALWQSPIPQNPI
jgi:hypothetical protein